MSTGGNVPQQGVEHKAQVDKRGPRGELGSGTPGSRLKSHYRKARKMDHSLKGSFRYFVNLCAKYHGTEPELKLRGDDARAWLVTKSGGTPEQKAARKQKRKDQKSTNLMAKMSRRGKGKSQKKTAA